MSGQVNFRHRRAGGDLAAAELEIWGERGRRTVLASNRGTACKPGCDHVTQYLATLSSFQSLWRIRHLPATKFGIPPRKTGTYKNNANPRFRGT